MSPSPSSPDVGSGSTVPVPAVDASSWVCFWSSCRVTSTAPADSASSSASLEVGCRDTAALPSVGLDGELVDGFSAVDCTNRDARSISHAEQCDLFCRVEFSFQNV
jgi:hypothetical protein